MPAQLRPPRASRLPPRRKRLRLHVSLHVEGRPATESFRLDYSLPTPPGLVDQICWQALSLRAATYALIMNSCMRIEVSQCGDDEGC